MLWRLLLIAAIWCASLPRLAAYSLTGTRWNVSSTTLHLQLGGNAAPLADGFASWGASAEDAVTLWNTQLANFRFNVVRDSTVTKAQGNRVNNVHFAGDIYGQAWGSGVLAVTLTYSAGTAQTETDVVFNNLLNWNSYRGPLRFTVSGQPMYDFHRVALHEFGHALGLDHPDQNGQSVTALMNSRVSSVEGLTSDDVSGGQALYGSANAAPVIAAPIITTQPANRSVTAGLSASFSVTATSAVALSYQWYRSGSALVGATSSTFTISATTTTDAGTYHVIVANAGGSVTSSGATLTVTQPAPVVTTPPPPSTPTPSPGLVPTAPTTPTLPPPSIPVAPVTPTVASLPPTIVSQPLDRTLLVGSNLTLNVSATGTTPLTYQWRKDGSALPGATGAIYSTASATVEQSGLYTAVVSSSGGSISTSGARVVIGTAPAVATQPVGQSVAPGAALLLQTSVTGSPTPTIQWFKDEVAIANATSPTLNIPTARLADAGSYRTSVTNVFGSVRSAAAVVSIQTPPSIATGPVAQSVNAGQNARFSVAANGSPPPSYQWLKNGAQIVGATSAEFVLTGTRASDTGSYAVRVSNQHGSVTAPAVDLLVRYSRLVNLSTRGFVPAGGALTPGFFIRGNGAKQLLVRAVGPTLATFGVGAALSETRLDLIGQTTGELVASNGDWSSMAGLPTAFAKVGAFPLAANSKDAAVQADLPAAAYTARITAGDAKMAGITLAEIYDSDSNDTETQLVNVSTLGFVGTGENALTAGFVVTGNTAKKLLIRAIGPGLAQFGVTGVLADPQIGVVPLGASEPLAANDDWGDQVALVDAFALAGAFKLPAGSRDAALVVTLGPGAYTVVVSGTTGGSTGNALVEIYDVDP